MLREPRFSIPARVGRLMSLLEQVHLPDRQRSSCLVGTLLRRQSFRRKIWRGFAVRLGHYSIPCSNRARLFGMMMFIASEVMFFVAWFWAYFNTAIFYNDDGVSGWPPAGIITLDPWHLPLLNTLILAFVVFLCVRTINQIKKSQAAEEAAAPPPPEGLCVRPTHRPQVFEFPWRYPRPPPAPA